MFYRSTTLSPSHYAGKWVIPAEDERYDLNVVNPLGLEYAKAIDSPEKEARRLQVIECFHGYLMKYVVMIVRWTIPPVGTHAGKDAKELLRQLSPRGAVLDKEQIDRTCETLHLAFKQASIEEIYDTLVFCLIKAARKYDPFYTDKVEAVCGIINVLPKQFTEQHLIDRVGYDCTGILRSLVRKHHLRSVTGKKVVKHRIGETGEASEHIEVDYDTDLPAHRLVSPHVNGLWRRHPSLNPPRCRTQFAFKGPRPPIWVFGREDGCQTKRSVGLRMSFNFPQSISDLKRN